MTSQKNTTALLLVGHGTRDPRGQAEFLELARLAAERLPQLPVRAAYLELASPDIPTAIDALLGEQPIERLYILPLLLFAAGHAKRDIPQAVSQALVRHPDVEVHQLPHLGTHPAVAALSARRMEEALAGSADIPRAETCGVLVGRGSHDSEARAEWGDFAAHREKLTPLGSFESCFLAMAKPTPEELLPRLLAGPWRRIIWQPHLLFHGELLGGLREFVERARGHAPGRDWIVTPHLGPDPSLAEAIAEMAVKALRNHA